MIYVIECLLKMGKVPRRWKRANIIPVYKNRSTEEPLNHRPVLLTSIVCKICEKSTIMGRLFRNEKILTDRQFGFERGAHFFPV